MCAALSPLQAHLRAGKILFPIKAVPCFHVLPLQARLGLLFSFCVFFYFAQRFLSEWKQCWFSPTWVSPLPPGFAHNRLTRPQRSRFGASPVLFSYPIRGPATNCRTGPSLVPPPFSDVLLLRQSCHLTFQVVIYCLLDRTDGKLQGAISHLTRFGAHLCRFHIDEPFFLQLPNVL